MQELIQEKNRLVRKLNECVKQLRRTGTDKAETERKYKELLSQEVLRLRDEGMPVTIIKEVVYGLKAVAAARFDRDVALTIYEANQEAINAIKLNLRIVNEQIQREWNSGNNEV